MPAQTLHSKLLGPVEVQARACPLCAQPAARGGPYSEDIWSVVDCPQCAFVYIDKAPVYAEMESNLAWEKSIEMEKTRRAGMRKFGYALSKRLAFRYRIFPRKKFSQMVAQLAQPGAVIDIGCGAGHQMQSAAPEFIPHGIEISRALSGQADAAFRARGGKCVCAPAPDGLAQLPAGHFTAVTMWAYLEHEAHPLAVLQQSHRVLRRGGIVLIKVPNYACWNRKLTGKKWPGFRYPDHLNYFTPASLGQMARKAGFTRCHQRASYRLPTSDNMYMVLEKE
ncbi:MAG: class I SAM-dependent methyltransferase [Gammaproteobacteria bacterium]